MPDLRQAIFVFAKSKSESLKQANMYLKPHVGTGFLLGAVAVIAAPRPSPTFSPLREGEAATTETAHRRKWRTGIGRMKIPQRLRCTWRVADTAGFLRPRNNLRMSVAISNSRLTSSSEA